MQLFIEISETLAERLATIAKKKGCEPADISPEIFRHGLDFLEKCSLRENKQTRRSRKREAGYRFIRENWEKMTDMAMALEFGASYQTIVRWREDLNLQRSYKPPEKGGKIRELVLAKINEPRPKPSRRPRSDARIIIEQNLSAIAEALKNGGSTITDIAKQYQLNVTRERLRQILLKHGLNGSAEERTTAWYANRTKIPQLADKDFVLQKFRESKSVRTLAANLKIKFATLLNIIHLHGISLDKPVETTTLKCFWCKKDFSREAKTDKSNKRRNPNKHDFCSRICFGQYIGKNFGLGKPKKSA